MLEQMDGRHLHFTATAMERVPLLLSSKSAVTYLVDTVTCLGIVIVSIRVFFPGTGVSTVILVHRAFLLFDQWLRRTLETRITQSILLFYNITL